MTSNKPISELSVWQYLIYRGDYWSSVIHVMENYLAGYVTMTNAKKTFKRSLRYAYRNTAKEAWIDGGGKLPLSKEARDYVRKYTQEQLAFVNDMFYKMRDLVKSGQFIDIPKLAQEKADLWSRSLDILYNNVKIINAGNEMLTFDGEDGEEESCEDCQRYKGQRHSAKWWVDHDAIPPHRDFACKGFNCRHYLRDDKNRIYTL